jgi:hypothetical protein
LHVSPRCSAAQNHTHSAATKSQRTADSSEGAKVLQQQSAKVLGTVNAKVLRAAQHAKTRFQLAAARRSLLWPSDIHPLTHIPDVPVCSHQKDCRSVLVVGVAGIYIHNLRRCLPVYLTAYMYIHSLSWCFFTQRHVILHPHCVKHHTTPHHTTTQSDMLYNAVATTTLPTPLSSSPHYLQTNKSRQLPISSRGP